MRQYRCTKIVGDKYGAQWTVEAFAKAGARYEQSELDRSAIYMNTQYSPRAVIGCAPPPKPGTGAKTGGAGSVPSRSPVLCEISYCWFFAGQIIE
jgi:hypothetical protein